MAEKERRDRSRLEGVLSYATCLTCRQQWIRDYFGETDPERCGRCDRCGRSRQEGARSLHPDEMLLLRKLLSGIARMSQRDPEGAWVARFGKGLILKMLAGSSDRRIRDLHLDRLSTYGLLKTLPKSGLEALCEAAADAGLLHSTGGLRPLLTLTAKGAAVMREEEMPAMVWPAGMIASPAPASRPRRLGSVPELELSAPSAPDADLVQALKRKRLQLARARGNAPPYTILNNRALEGLARLRPATPEDAMRVPGIGPGKARSVVPAFIGVIQSWQQGTREAG